MARQNEPTRGPGFRRLLRKHVFNIFLIDKFKASKAFPQWRQEIVQTFKRVRNPRPHRSNQRRGRQNVSRHELLR
ncbi:hypothetical protein PS15m_002494 [Mucor circinelloides]